MFRMNLEKGLVNRKCNSNDDPVSSSDNLVISRGVENER